MKRLLFLLFLTISLIANAQVPADTAALRHKINTDIITNGTKAITAVQLNNILIGITNLMKANAVDSGYRVNDTIFLTRRGYPVIKIVLNSGGAPSETDPTVSSAAKNITQDDKDAWNAKQAALTAGAGIDLSGNIVKAKTDSALWNALKLKGNSISDSVPVVGEVLTWDGTNWTPAENPAATPPGNDQNVIFNDGGSMAGNDNFLFDKVNRGACIGCGVAVGDAYLSGAGGMHGTFSISPENGSLNLSGDTVTLKSTAGTNHAVRIITNNQERLKIPTSGSIYFPALTHSIIDTTALKTLAYNPSTNEMTYTNWPAAGGGFTSPMNSAGDLIYGGSAGSPLRLPKGTGSQVLHSGTTPAYGPVVLTSEVSGVLPISNMATGTPDGTKFVGDDGTLKVPSDPTKLPLSQSVDNTLLGNGHALVLSGQSVAQVKTTLLIGDTITRVGTLFADNFIRGSLGSNWGSALPNASLNFTSGRMAISGGVGDFTNYIQFAAPTGRKRGFMTFGCRITTVNSTSYGVSLGPKSTNSNLQTSIKAQFCMHTGGNLGTIVFWDGSGNQIGSASAGQTISSGDSLFCIMEWVDNVVNATYMNVTAASFVTNSFTYSTATGSTPVIPNTGKLTIFFNGGSQTNPSFLYSSNDVVGSVAFMGNSIMTGYDATVISKRYVSRIYGSRDDYTLYGGPGDASIDLLKSLPEVAATGHRIIFICDGVNDALNAYSTTNYSLNIDSAVRYLSIHSPGSRIVLVESCPQGSVLIKPYNDSLHAIGARYSLTVVPLYDTLRSGTTWKTQYNGGDDIHPSDSGMGVIAYKLVTTVPEMLSTPSGGNLYYPSMPSTTNTSLDLVAIDHGHPYHIPFSLFGTTSTNLQGAFDASNTLNRNNSLNMGSHLFSFKNSADSMKIAISSGTADFTINRFNFNAAMMSMNGNPFTLQFDGGGGAVCQLQHNGGAFRYSSTGGMPFQISGNFAFQLLMENSTDRIGARLFDQASADAGFIGAWGSTHASAAFRSAVGIEGKSLSTAGVVVIDSNNNVIIGDLGTIPVVGSQRLHILGTTKTYDEGSLVKRFNYITNIGSTFTLRSLIDKNYCDSAIAASLAAFASTLDIVSTKEITTTDASTINVDTFAIAPGEKIRVEIVMDAAKDNGHASVGAKKSISFLLDDASSLHAGTLHTNEAEEYLGSGLSTASFTIVASGGKAILQFTGEASTNILAKFTETITRKGAPL